jgi:putative hydroxymethylpyrimidine transport system substrate-binding protein
VLYLLNHPEESFGLFTEGRPELDDELNRRAFADTLPRFALRPAAMDKARYARFAAFLEERGLIKSPPPVDSYAIELPR